MIAQATRSSLENLRVKLPLALHSLADLAFNFWWSWSSEHQLIFRSIDPPQWQKLQQNPVKFLQSVSSDRWSQLAADSHYLQQVKSAAGELANYLHRQDTWAHRTVPEITVQQPIAYFSIEFGLHPCLPIYSGGLGILAADHLKSASDLGLPLVAIGLFYHQGYLSQRIDAAGWQAEDYPNYSPEELPLTLCRNAEGDALTIVIEVSGRQVNAQIWQAQVGRVPLYLLDTNREENHPDDRQITHRLYGGDDAYRITQEILLGIGGVRALQSLGFEPHTYHLNEGHAGFALLELARREMQRTGQTFAAVKESVRDRCVFTTHTPVPAGHDSFSIDLIEQHFSHYWTQLGLSREEFVKLADDLPEEFGNPFNMTALALRLSRSANGVSQLNGEVCRQMWSVVYRDRPVDQVPITAITNGVHAETWIAPLMADLYAQYLRADWATRVTESSLWDNVDRIPADDLWQRHQSLKQDLIAAVCSRRSASQGSQANCLLDPTVLTLGFARRFSTYKRGNLLFHDPERAKAIFGNPEHPVQILFAGKAHPADDASKEIIQELMQWSQDSGFGDRLIFIENHDFEIAKQLVQGVDVWLNTPRRPKEASGTSGQKAALNGGIHCSTLDGWWDEAYQVGEDGKGINGWAIGTSDEVSDSDLQDEQDAQALYRLLETEIIPCYYDRDRQGLPQRWIQLMKASIKTVAPYFNTDRMVKEYVTQLYKPGATEKD